MKVAVVGGGLAGLAAALELSKEGNDVVLLEARPTLGGAVQTLPEREGDPSPPPDNGQHIALGCCTAYLAFVAEIGQEPALRRLRLRLPVVAEDGRVATIRPGLVGLLRYVHLDVAERLAVARVARRLAKLDPALHDEETFGALLRRLGQSQAGIDRFWDVFVRPALNLRSDDVSAELGIFTVQTALLAGRGASDLLLPTAPLGEMHGEAAGEELRRRGGEISLDTRVGSLDELDSDGVVLAVPPAESARLLGEAPPRLVDSPIVSVHLLLDRPVLRFPLAALLGSDAHWVFDRGALTGHVPEQGQYLTVVSSGAPELLQLRGRALVDHIAGEVTARLGRAEVLWSRVSREPAATFAARPGTTRERPGPRTRRPDVVRAGAWTDTGWPATMEGAIRSGREAARVLAASVREKVVA
ncbi:MAG: hydroxysqualene dehydroxylase HpnE [Gaiellaceae bacterium]